MTDLRLVSKINKIYEVYNKPAFKTCGPIGSPKEKIPTQRGPMLQVIPKDDVISAVKNNRGIGIVPSSINRSVIDNDEGDHKQILSDSVPLSITQSRTPGRYHLVFPYALRHNGQHQWKYNDAGGETRVDRGFIVVYASEVLDIFDEQTRCAPLWGTIVDRIFTGALNKSGPKKPVNPNQNKQFQPADGLKVTNAIEALKATDLPNRYIYQFLEERHEGRAIALNRFLFISLITYFREGELDLPDEIIDILRTIIVGYRWRGSERHPLTGNEFDKYVKSTTQRAAAKFINEQIERRPNFMDFAIRRALKKSNYKNNFITKQDILFCLNEFCYYHNLALPGDIKNKLKKKIKNLMSYNRKYHLEPRRRIINGIYMRGYINYNSN